MELPASLLSLVPEGGDVQKVIEEPIVCSLPFLRVELDHRKGRTATLITGYEDDCPQVRELAATLRHRLAVGGSYRDGEILLQGDVRVRVGMLLEELGYKIKRINF